MPIIDIGTGKPLARSPEEVERWRRIRVSLWAYAYEVHNVSMVTDHAFDRECGLIDPSISTGNPLMDEFFRTEFDPCTGMWIHKHPELNKIKKIFHTLTTQ